MYRFKLDPCGNPQSFREEDFKIMTSPRTFLSEYDQLEIKKIPDPGKVLFGFYFTNQERKRVKKGRRRNPLFGSVEIEKMFKTQGKG